MQRIENLLAKAEPKKRKQTSSKVKDKSDTKRAMIQSNAQVSGPSPASTATIPTTERISSVTSLNSTQDGSTQTTIRSTQTLAYYGNTPTFQQLLNDKDRKIDYLRLTLDSYKAENRQQANEIKRLEKTLERYQNYTVRLECDLEILKQSQSPQMSNKTVYQSSSSPFLNSEESNTESRFRLFSGVVRQDSPSSFLVDETEKQSSQTPLKTSTVSY